MREKKERKENMTGNRMFYWLNLGICIFVISIGFLVFTGYGFFRGVEPEDNYNAPEEDLIVVGFSQLGSESVWRTAHTASVQGALSKEQGIFLIFNNARQKQENQIKAIRSFISQQVDYIVFSPVTEDGWDTVLQEAKDAGIPVILTDRMVNVADNSLYTAFIGTDKWEEGEKAGKWLEKYLREKRMEREEIKIVVLEGTAGSSAQLGRTMGFNAIMNEHENWTVLEYADGDFTTTKGKEVMEEMLRKYSDIDVVVSQNDDMTFGVIEAMREAGVSFGEYGDVAVISFDAGREALEMVKKGLINVDIECNPEQGEYILEVIKKLEAGEPVEKSYLVEESVFTKENVADYIEERTY